VKYKHFVTLGHLDHGKSSLVGRLLWDMGKVGKRAKSYLVEIGGKEGRQFAYVLDQKREEQGRGITIDVGHNKLLVDGFSFIFSDAPGHEVFLDKAYKGIEESNGAIVVIAADEGIKEQTKKHIAHALKLGLDDFVVCVNKMDKVGYQEEVFRKIAAEADKLFKGNVVKFIIPTSATEGENIVKKSKKMAWFKGKTFLGALKAVKIKQNTIDELVEQSKEIIKKAVKAFKKPVMLWAGGKDSTTSIAIAREMFKGKLPFPVMFIDTTYKFTETYEFIDKYAKEWTLDLFIVKNQKALESGIDPWSVSHFKYCHELKTKPLKKAIADHGFDCVITSIRWDEHGIRGKEQYFSQRTDPPHTRVHPILHFSETEVWKYLKGRKIPYNPLYDKEEHNGLVYRSIGCWPFTKPVPKDEVEERAGREGDTERLMESLRSLGYM
jgi:sulfate adenylyltransferase subunit 2